MNNPFVADKILYHPERIVSWLRQENPAPVVVELDLTNRCTDRCPHCTGGRVERSAVLPLDLAVEVLHDIKTIGAKAVIFTGGGEPLCHQGVGTCVEYATQLGLDVGLITNGVLLEPPRISALRGCKWVRVSLDAETPERYLVTHGTDNFERVVANTRAFVGAMRGNGTTTGVGYLVDSHTVFGMANAAAFCASLGVNYLQFRPFHHAANEHGLYEKVDAEMKKARQYEGNGYSVVCSTHKFKRMSQDDGSPKRPYQKCYGQAFAATICATGDVTLCCHMRGIPKYILGNVKEQKFSEIWNSDRRQHVIESLDFADCPAYCRCDPFNCFLWSLKHEQPEHVNFL